MINIAIVEDEIYFYETLKSYIDKFMEEKNQSVKIDFFNNASSFINIDNKFDFVFMDIDLKDKINGMDAARELRKKDKNVFIFFVTNLAQYAINGYEVEAFDYILKPINYYSFSMKFDRGYQCFKNKNGSVIVLNTRNGQETIRSTDIKYVEIVEHKLSFHTINGTFCATGTMKSIIEKLDGESFCLCNQCYLVNLKYVNGIYDNQVKIDNNLLLISIPKRKAFLRELNNYLGSGNKLK